MARSCPGQRCCDGLTDRLILGLETSCDETAAALVTDDGHIRANVVSSQADLHARYGGVVPEVASRRHLELVTPVIREALAEAEAADKATALLVVAKLQAHAFGIVSSAPEAVILLQTNVAGVVTAATGFGWHTALIVACAMWNARRRTERAGNKREACVCHIRL